MTPAAAAPNGSPVLELRGVVTAMRTERGTIRPVDNVSFSVRAGKTLALVGESGCGKSVTALTILRLLPSDNATVERGEILFEGRDVLKLRSDELRSYRGNRAAMIFQEPMTALNPVKTVGSQVAEVFRLHRKASRREAWDGAVAMLTKVRIADPAARAKQYPHELSGGMRQRVMIAMALACNPAMLIADEPTTALDVTIQAQVLELMRVLQRELGTSMLFITHDLGVVAQVADEVAVMYAGRIVEQAEVRALFAAPLHPYTHGLMSARPSLGGQRRERLQTIEGLVPALYALPKGCRFVDRCPRAEDVCKEIDPPLVALRMRTDGSIRRVACHVAEREVVASQAAERVSADPADEVRS
jgi:oligopeptide/dipeptide ABC transporter ATP-binding protein